MREKLVYRSHFQPAPPVPSQDVVLPKSRYGSPYRVASRPRPVLRHLLRGGLVLVTAYISILWIHALTGLDLTLGCVPSWLWGPTRVKSSQEWRKMYDAMEMGLEDLPLGFTLPSGDEIPSVALGTWQASSGSIGHAVEVALEAGYRHFDGAWIYGNEKEIGDTLTRLSSRYPRSSLFITSKLWNTFHAPEDIEPALDLTLASLQTSYLDLYLVHWPVAFDKETGNVDEYLTEHPVKTWKVLEELVKKGKIRNIGVSNFNQRRLLNLTSSDITIKPAVNQVELNFWNPQPELLKWSKGQGILLEAYSPLGGSRTVNKSLRLPIVRDISKKLRITPAQVLISWHVQRGTIVLPKSVHPGRIAEDYQIFTLPTDLFNALENAATSHPPHRESDPSSRWGIDIFEDDEEYQRPHVH